MPLQHTHEHEEQSAPLRAFAPQEPFQEAVQETSLEAAPVSITLDTPRYDAAAVKQIIALAEQMQSHHRQTLTPEEVEALGHEVGVEPAFIRRALAQLEAARSVSSKRIEGRQTGKKRATSAHFTCFDAPLCNRIIHSVAKRLL